MHALPDLTRLSLQPTSEELLLDDPEDEIEMPSTAVLMPGDFKPLKSFKQREAEIVHEGKPFGQLNNTEMNMMRALALRGFAAFRRNEDENGKVVEYTLQWMWRLRERRFRLADDDLAWKADWIEAIMRGLPRSLTIADFEVVDMSITDEDALRYAQNLMRFRFGALYNPGTKTWSIKRFQYGTMEEGLETLVDDTDWFEKTIMMELVDERNKQYHLIKATHEAKLEAERAAEEQRKREAMALRLAGFEKQQELQKKLAAEKAEQEAAQKAEAARRHEQAEREWEALVKRILAGGELSDEDRAWFATTFGREQREADAALAQAVQNFYSAEYNYKLARDQVESNARHVELSSLRLVQLESYLLGVAHELTKQVVQLFEAEGKRAHTHCDTFTGVATRLVHLPAAQPPPGAAAAPTPRTIPVIVRATTHPSSIRNNPSPPQTAEAAVKFTMRIANKCDGKAALTTSTDQEREMYRQAIAYGMVVIGHYQRKVNPSAPDEYHTNSKVTSPNTVRAMLEGLWRRYWLHTFGKGGLDGPADPQTANRVLFRQASQLIGANPVNAQDSVRSLTEEAPASSAAAGEDPADCEE